MIDLTKPVQRRDGRPARIVSTKGAGMFPVLAIVTDEVTGTEWMTRHTLGGAATGVPGESPADLTNVSVETEEFFNVYLDDMHFIGPKESLEEADEDADETRSFVIKLVRRDGELKDAVLLHHVA